MKYFLLTLSLLLAYVLASAQISNDVVIGTTVNKKDITGKRVELDGRISGYINDSSSGEIIVGVNVAGACSYIVVIDKKTLNIKRRICIQGNIRYIRITPGCITAITPAFIEGYNRNTGRYMWRHTVRNHLQGAFSFAATDSCLVHCNADSISFLNVNTGKTVKHLIHTVRREGSGNSANGAQLAAVAVAGVTFGLVGGLAAGVMTGMIHDGDQPQTSYSSCLSNICTDRNRVYFADKDTVFCFDHSGSIVWKNALPADSGSKSQLEVRGNNLYMLNYGYVLDAGLKMAWRGDAFRTVYNKENGTTLMTANIPCNRYILSTLVTNDTLLIQSEHYIHKLDNTTYQTLSTTKIKNILPTQYVYFIDGTKHYIEVFPNIFKQLCHVYPNNYFLADKGNKILRTTLNFAIADSIAPGILWREVSKKDSLCILERGEHTKLLANEKAIANIVLHHPILLDDKIIEISEGRVTYSYVN